MFWKSSASSSLLEGEHDAEASSHATNGRPRRSGAPVRSRLMLSRPTVSRNIGHVSKVHYSHAKAFGASMSAEVKDAELYV
jgi:hypothetical protein